MAGGLFLGGLFVYTKLLKTYPNEEVLKIFMRFLWLGSFFDFLMMVFKCISYPKQEPKPKSLNFLKKYDLNWNLFI